MALGERLRLITPATSVDSAAGGIELLIEINPKDAGEKSNRGSERQEQDDGPDDVFGEPPAGDGPEQHGK